MLFRSVKKSESGMLVESMTPIFVNKDQVPAVSRPSADLLSLRDSDRLTLTSTPQRHGTVTQTRQIRHQSAVFAAHLLRRKKGM